MNNRRERKTSRYTLVIHEVSQSSAKIWLGALLPSVAKPHNWCIVVKKVHSGFSREDEVGEEVTRIEFLKEKGDVWLRPFDKLNKRFYKVEVINGLESGQDYVVEFLARTNQEWQLLETAFFTTLPENIHHTVESPFTVGVGSCFYTKHDGGRAGQAYEALYKNDKLKPDLKFLVGDQVYLDIGLGLYPLDDEDCQTRIADDYAESWGQLRSILRRGGTWMLADDHEYWNNYPFLKGFNPYLITLMLSDNFKKRWESAAKRGVDVVQQMQSIRTFSIGRDLSFCVADFRSERSNSGFLSEESFSKLMNWIEGLNSAGVLVIPQPLIAAKGDNNDSNLPDWQQYNELLLKIQSCNHDIVVLTGDVHYGRVSQVMMGNSSNKLIEVITSPISNLSELDGIAAATPDLSKRKFPLVEIPGFIKNKIKYLGKITTESKWWDLRFPVERTTEHFMTVDFYKESGDLKMKINAWNARKIVKKTGLPKKINGFNVNPITLK